MAHQDFSLKHCMRVRWAEVDRQGIVFNGHYLAYFDVAITEYWRALGYPYPDALLARDCDMFVVKATVEYHAPARYDDLLEVCARVGRLGSSSIKFLMEIHRGAEHLVSGEVIYVNADPTERKPKPVPDFLREAIWQFEVVTPARK
ncbi:MAG: acyl-CoA thioesterase [Betaproteobacteria bacterium]|nr:acyl-CoA thioesterase [Betaproteobacteria bacterium]